MMGLQDPAALAAAMGVQYTPGMTYEDFQKQVLAKQGGPAGPIAPPPNALPPPPATAQDFRAMAAANAAPPEVKKVALEGVPIPPPSGKPAAGPGPGQADDDGLGMSFKQYASLAPKGSPGGWREMQAKPVKEQQEKANLSQSIADQATTEANTGVSEAQAAGHYSMAGVAEAARMEAEKAEQRRQSIMDSHVQEQNKLAKDVADFKINPDDYYGSGGAAVLKRSLNIIATSLGGYAAGLRGGPNIVQESIDRDIDRFVDAQKAELSKKQGLLQQSNSRFGQLVQQFGDQRAAEAAMKADLYSAVQAQAEGLVQNAKTDQQRADGLQRVAAAEQKKTEQLDHAYKLIPATSGPSVQSLLKDYQAAQKNAAEISHLRSETAVNRAKAEAGGGAPKKGLPGGVITQLSSIDSAVQALDDEIALSKDDKIPLADRRARSKRNLDTLSLEIPHAFTGGVPTPEQQHETRANLPADQGTLSSVTQLADRTRMLEDQRRQLLHKRRALEATANEARQVGSGGPEDEK